MKIVFAVLVYSSTGVWPVDIELYAREKDCKIAEARFNSMWAPDYKALCTPMNVYR